MNAVGIDVSRKSRSGLWEVVALSLSHRQTDYLKAWKVKVKVQGASCQRGL